MESRVSGRKKLKVEKTCRLCMRDREYYLSIFPANDVCKIGKAIQELLNLEVSEDDGLPGTVCRQCFAKLVDFRAFKEMCVKSARELRKRAPKKTTKRPAKDKVLPVQLPDEGEGSSGINFVSNEPRAPSEPDPLAEETQDDREVAPSSAPQGESDDGEEGPAEEECFKGTAVYIECTPLVLPDQVHVKEEPEEEEPEESMVQENTEWSEDYDKEEYSDAAGSNIGAEQQNYGQMMDVEGDNSTLVHNEEPRGGGYAEEECQGKSVPDFHFSSYGFGSQAHCSSEIGGNPGEPSKMLSDLEPEREVITPDSSQGSSFYGSSKSQADMDPSLKPFKCEICGKGFTRKSYLRNHSVIHSDTKQFKCEVCGKEFNQKAHLNTHAVVHTGLKPFKCETCGKEYNRMDSLKTHQLIHIGLKPYKCDICGKAFHDRSNLRSHAALHSNKREFKCDVCGVEFNQRGNLKKHEAIHTGVKPFKCEVCGKEFMLKDILQKHSAIHTGLRPFKCEICGKQFNRRDSLKTHEIIHTGLKPFVCDVCGKDFNDKRNLKTHKVVHSDNRAFKCEICGKTYKTPASLKNHMALHS